MVLGNLSSKEQVTVLLNSLGEAIHILDEDLQIRFLNKSMKTWLKGYDVEPKIVGKRINYAFPFISPKVIKEYVDVFKSGKVLVTEESTFVNGMKIITRIRKVPIYTNGKISNVMTLISDITDQKLNELEIENLAKFPDENMNPVFRATRDGKILYANNSCSELLLRWGCEINKYLPFVVVQKIEDAFTNGRSMEIEELVDDRTYSLTITPIIDQGYANIYGNEITAIKESTKYLVESERKYRELFENVPIGLYRTSLDGEIIEVNQTLLDMLGYSDIDSIRKMKSMDFYADPDERDRFQELLKEVGIVKNFQFKALTKDGRLIWLSDNSLGIRDANGKTIYYQGALRDITEKVEATKKLEDERSRAEFYLDLLGHDIGNLHQGIWAWMLLGKEKVGDKKTDAMVNENTSILVKRSIDLVKNVLLLSRLENSKIDFQRVDLVQTIEFSLDRAREINPNIDLAVDLDLNETDHYVQAEPIISELFFNIINNAISVQMENGKKPHIYISINREIENEISIDIADEGPGIPDERKMDMFSRFERSADRAHTGIGLSIVRSLVDRYGGSIEIMDRISGDHSKGALFRIHLPGSVDE